jgi:2-oxoglutarate ferredoxin oxidoreductase subunit alpha
MDRLDESGISTKFLQIRTLWPFLNKDVEGFMEGCKKIFVVDNNYEGQLAQLIRSQVSTRVELHNILNFSGLTFRPGDIEETIRKAL